MRITNNTVVRRYISNLEMNYSKKNASENKITSNRKYTRASQSPLEAARALKVRKAMSEAETYQSNLNNAKSIYESAESAVMKVSSLIQSTYEKLIYGANGEKNDDDCKIIGETIETYADEMMRLMNLTVADRKIFGGVNNDTNAYAIETDEAGNKTVTYNDVAVNTYQNASNFPYSNSSFLDIGIGMTLPDGSVDSQTALPITFNGAEILGSGLSDSLISLNLDELQAGGNYSIDVTLGTKTNTIAFTAGNNAFETANTLNSLFDEAFGYDAVQIDDETGLISAPNTTDPLAVTNSVHKDEDGADFMDTDVKLTPTGYANNIIQLTLDAAACLKNGDKEGAAKYADQLMASQTTLSLSLADIGNQEEFIDFNAERLTNNLYTLESRQNDLEGTDLGTEITNWKVLESIYDASLQMGTSTIPKSIFDFL